MGFIEILQIISAGLTALIGAAFFFRPLQFEDFTGLDPDKPRGKTEIRSAVGGFYLGFGLTALIYGGDVYPALGVTYLIVAGTRLIAMFWDGSQREQSNIISLISEIVLGVILLLPVS